MNTKELQDYRIKLFTDVYNNVVPDRVPIIDSINFGCHAELAGENYFDLLHNMTAERLTKVFDNTMTFAKGDSVSLGTQHSPVGLMLKKSQIYKAAKSGMIQHPEVCTMEADEYDEFIEDPYAFMVSKIYPRSYKMAQTDDPEMMIINYMRFKFYEDSFDQTKAMVQRDCVDKYGLFKSPAGTGGALPVPFDVLADVYRGFSNIVKDIRRIPEQVEAACESLVPYAMWMGNKSKVHPLGSNMIATHMGPYIRVKDFERFYFPTFKKLIHMQAARGQMTNIFCENNWDKLVDYLEELPMGTRLRFEQGTPQLIKDKMGKKMPLAGLYPIGLIKTGTKDQCVDEAKRLLDVMMPGGNFYFTFDKTALRKEDLNLENYAAVMDYVLEHGHYDNAGEQVSSVKREDTIIDYGSCPEFKSKYFTPFDEWVKDFEIPDESVRDIYKKAYEDNSSKAYGLLVWY